MPQDVEETQVEAAALALAHKKLLGHKDDGVRAAVAGCLAEVLRVYAPKTPYDDKAQMAIFALFLAQSAALKRVHGPGYDAAVELYVRLAEIKAMVLLVFLDGPLALRAFRELFECVRKVRRGCCQGSREALTAGPQEHFELGVAETLLTVLCDMVNEMDTVPAEVLHVVFQHLVGQDTYPEAYQLAKVTDALSLKWLLDDCCFDRFFSAFSDALCGAAGRPRVCGPSGPAHERRRCRCQL